MTDASVHDSYVFKMLLDNTNSSRDVYADSAYRSAESVKHLNEKGYRPHLQRKGSHYKKVDGMGETGKPHPNKNPLSGETCLRSSSHDRRQPDTQDDRSCQGKGKNRTEKPGLQYESVQNIGRKWDLVKRRGEKSLSGTFLTRSSTLY